MHSRVAYIAYRWTIVKQVAILEAISHTSQIVCVLWWWCGLCQRLWCIRGSASRCITVKVRVRVVQRALSLIMLIVFWRLIELTQVRWVCVGIGVRLVIVVDWSYVFCCLLPTCLLAIWSTSLVYLSGCKLIHVVLICICHFVSELCICTLFDDDDVLLVFCIVM